MANENIWLASYFNLVWYSLTIIYDALPPFPAKNHVPDTVISALQFYCDTSIKTSRRHQSYDYISMNLITSSHIINPPGPLLLWTNMRIITCN